MKKDILGVKVDDINFEDALSQVERWIWNKPAYRTGKHYIVTPNLEFILAAQKDAEFKKALNSADLAIPDSSNLGLSYWLLKKSIWERLLLWPLFFFPVKQLMQFERIAGTDFMEALCRLAAENGFVVGFLGGKDEVAKKTAECLKKKYPGLKVAFTESGGNVDASGQWAGLFDHEIPPMDILFVAFGHIKQEKWIANNLENVPVKIAMGVGGAFDYLSGSVPRAPVWVRHLGFEWLFRLIFQPWRIKRQLALIKYLQNVIV